MEERTIFLNALERTDPEERANYLGEACAGNSQLRRQVDELLRASSDAGEFLESPPPALVATIASGAFDTGLERDEVHASLDFLAPCDKPGCLGRLAQYEVVDVVGHGGMGLVLRAFDSKLNRVVAIKVMAPELAANPMAVKRFLREAKAAAAVSHDHVVTIHHIHDAHRPPFLVMEFVDGQSLQQKIDRVGAMELQEILRIGVQTASGLAAAHKQGLVHRDIKPANILLENGVERVKITDFGLARTTDDVGMTQTGQIAGTPQYMSPEQAQGQPVDPRSDLFSLGSVLYTMCTGRPPFRADSAVAMLRRVCDDDPRPIRQVNVEIPEWLEAIIDKLLAKHPDDRFQSAEEVADLLSRHLAHLQHPAASPMPQPIILAARASDASLEKELQSEARYLWATGILSLVMGMLAVLMLIRAVVFGLAGLPPVIVLLMVSGLISLPMSLAIMFGAHHAERRQSYGWAMAAAVLSLIPFNLFLFFLIPITIWTIARLRRPQIRAAFESQRGRVFLARAVVGAAPPGKPPRIEPWDAPRSSQRWAWYSLGALLGIFVLLIGLAAAAWFYRSTSYGIVVFDSPVDHLEIESLQDGRVLQVYDTLHGGGTRWHVPVGEWKFRIKNDQSYFVTPSQIAVARGSYTTIRVMPRSARPSRTGAFLEEVGRWEGHSDNIDCLAYSRDGKYLFSGGGERRLYQWDAATGKVIRKIPVGVFIVGVAPHPDGKRVFTSQDDGGITLWDLATGRAVRNYSGHADRARALAVSPDGLKLLSGGHDGLTRLWDVETGDPLRDFSSGYCEAVAIAPDGKTAAHDTAKGIEVWEVASGKSICSLPRGGPALSSMAFSPDGRYVLGGNQVGEVRVWDVTNGHELFFLDGHTAPVRSLVFTPDGRYFVSGSEDKTIRVVAWSTGKEVCRIDCEKTYSQHLALSPDGRTLASAGGLIITQDPTGRWRLTKDGDYAIHLWRLVESDSPDGVQGKDGGPKVPSKIAEVRRYEGHSEQVSSLDVSRDGKWLASAAADGTARIWDIESRRVVHALTRNCPEHSLSVALSPDSRRAATADWDGKLRIWNLPPDGAPIEKDAHAGGAYHVEFSADGTKLVTSGCDNTAKLWDAATGELLKTFEGHTGWVADVAFGPDGRWIATAASDETIRLWDPESGQEVRNLLSVRGLAFSLAWSPDGRRLAAGFFDGSLRLYDPQTGIEVLRLNGHGDRVRDIAFTPDGRRLVSGAWDKTLRVWDLETGREVSRASSDKHIFNAIAITPDGRHVFSGGGIWMPDEEKNEWVIESDYAIRQWRLPPRTWPATSARLYTITPAGEVVRIGVKEKSFTTTVVKNAGIELHSAEGLTMGDGVLYAAINQASGDSQLFAIDPDTGDASPRGTLGVRQVDGLAWSDGELLGVTSRFGGARFDGADAGRLVSIDPATGSTRPIGDKLNLDDLDSLTFDDRGRLIATDGMGVDDRFYELDRRGIAAPKPLAPTPALTESRDIEGLTLASDGNFYGVTHPDGTPENVSYLLRIDPDTFEYENLGKLSFGAFCIAADLRPQAESVAADDLRQTQAPPREITTAERLFTGEHDSGVFAIGISPDGGQALTGHFSGAVCLWDIATGKELRRFEGHSKTVQKVLFWPDGQHVLTGSEDGTIRLWDLESAQEVRQFRGHTGRVECLALAQSEQLLLSASSDYENDQDNSIRLWDAKTGEQVRQFSGQILYTTDVAFSRDGRHAYGCGPGQDSLTQWDVATGKAVHRFPQFQSIPIRLALSPDGRQLAAAYSAKTKRDGEWHDRENCVVRLWDLSTRSVIREFEGHTGPIADIAFTPGGRRLLTLADGRHNTEGQFVPSSDHSVRLWDVNTGRELARYGPQERVHSLAVSPHGESFLTGGESLRLWRLPEEM